MKYPYVVILKKTGQRATDVLSVFLTILSIACFAFIGLGSYRHTQWSTSEFAGESREMTRNGLLLLLIALILVIGLALTIPAKRRLRPGKLRFRYMLLLAAMGWMFFTPAPWVGFFFLLLTFLEHQTKRPLEVGFDYNRVVINALIKREFEWSAFSNVILKDGLLTLDFKSNRLIQREVAEDDEDNDADEEEFNDWCRQRLAGAQPESR